MLVGNLDGLPPALTGLTTTGLLRQMEPREVARWVESVCSAGFARASEDKYRTLSLTALGREVMAGRVREVALVVPRARAFGYKRRRRSKRGV
jgi:hypothetical protein